MTERIDWKPLRSVLDKLAHQSLTQVQIADKLGVSRMSLVRYCRAHNLQLPRQPSGPKHGRPLSRPRDAEWTEKLKASRRASGAIERLADMLRGKPRPQHVRDAISRTKRVRRERAIAAAPYRGITAREGLSDTCGRRGVAA